MRYFTLLALALLFCSSCALCQTNSTTQDDTIASALRALVVDSSAKLGSYSFSMELDQNMNLVNLSSGESQQIQTRSIGFGFANMTDRALKLVMASLTYAEGDEVNSTAVALDEYLINDTIYLKVDGNWTILQLPGVSDAWSRQNTMEQQIDMFNQSEISVMGSEVVDGEDCYKIRAKIDLSAYAGQLSEEVASYVSVLSLNSSDLFRNMTLEVYYWIAKDTHLLKKTDIIETFNFTPQSLGLPATGPESIEIHMNSTTSMIFDGFNESVKIVLPPEARMAQPLPIGEFASSEAIPVSSTGNETVASEALSNEALPHTMTSNATMANAATSNFAASNATMANAAVPNSAAPNAAVPNARVPNATTFNATIANAATSSASVTNATAPEDEPTQAASTAWSIFL